MRKAVVYCRLSRNRTGERSASTARQEHDCRALAVSRGWEVVAVEVDDDVSAYSGKRRPGYHRVLAAVESGAVDAVLAWAPDRLHRSPAELETFIDLVESVGAEVATVRAGRVDLATPAGRLNARLLGNIARYESEHRSDRTRAAHDQLAAEGRWKGGRRPYGYQPVIGTGRLEVIDEEAVVIREAAARVIAGERVGTVAADLNRREIPTVTGSQWTTPTLRRILGSFTVAGHRESKGVDVGPAQWDAILDPDTAHAVRSVLAAGHRRGRVPRVSLLTAGRCVCTRCSAPMTTARRDNGGRIYRCRACFMQVAADALEHLVVESVLYRLDRAELPDVAGPDVRPAVAVDDLEDQLSQLAADHGNGLIGRSEWMAARTPLLARLDAARSALARAADSATMAGLTAPGAAREAWPNLTLERRQAVLDAWLSSVEVSPAVRRGPGLDPDRINLRWKA